MCMGRGTSTLPLASWEKASSTAPTSSALGLTLLMMVS